MLIPDYFLKSVIDVDIDFINKNNIKAVVFDVDNTLVGFKEPNPDDRIKAYIQDLKNNGIKVAVASNNSKHRVSVFCEQIDVPFVYRACKPLPFSVVGLCKKMGVKTKNTAFVGDQIYTDMLCANLCGMTSVLVDIIDTKENLTFKIKRALEKPVIKAKIRKDVKKNG